MQMPAASFVCYFDAVETSSPGIGGDGVVCVSLWLPLGYGCSVACGFALPPVVGFGGECAVAQLGEAVLQLVDVGLGQVVRVGDCEHDMFRLGYLSGPPLNGFFALAGQAGLAFGAVELIATVGEATCLAARIADGVCEVGMAILQLFGQIGALGLPKFGRDAEFVLGLGGPKLGLA